MLTGLSFHSYGTVKSISDSYTSGSLSKAFSCADNFEYNNVVEQIELCLTPCCDKGTSGICERWHNVWVMPRINI